MIWKKKSIWASLLLLALCGCCGGACGPQGLLDDPLYAGRKPQLSQPDSGLPPGLTAFEPRMPAPPNEAKLVDQKGRQLDPNADAPNAVRPVSNQRHKSKS